MWEGNKHQNCLEKERLGRDSKYLKHMNNMKCILQNKNENKIKYKIKDIFQHKFEN